MPAKTNKRLLYNQFVAFVLGVILAAAAPASALELEGFTEPYRSIEVAADETGTIEEVFVREGQTVAAGQPLVRLNSKVHLALLAIADQNMRATGRLDAAKADLQMRRERLGKLRSLRVEGMPGKKKSIVPPPTSPWPTRMSARHKRTC